MKITKLKHWSMELSHYKLTLIHIKGSNNILADAFPTLKTLGIYKELLDNPKTSDTMTHIAKMVSSNIETLSIDELHTEEKNDIHCREISCTITL